MRLAIDYHYRITYVPYRHQNDRSATGAARTEVDIREVTATEAPLAMRVGNRPGTKGPKRFAAREDGSLREVRMHGGRYWLEVGPASDLEEQVGPRLKASVFGKCDAWVEHDPNPAKKDHRAPVTAEDIRRRETYPLRTLRDDGGKRKAEELAHRASTLLIVDGTLFQQTAEPVLCKSPYDREAFVGPRPPRPDATDRWDHFEIYASSTFRDSTSYEALSSAGSLLSSVRHPYDGETEIGCDFEVLDPSASTFDGTAHDVSMLANSIMGEMRSNAGLLTRDGLIAMYGLRDALREAMGSATPRLVEALEVVSSLDAPDMDERRGIALRRAGKSTKRYGYEKTFEGELGKDDAAKAMVSCTRKAKDALARWDARPAGLGWEAECVTPSSLRKDRSWSRHLLSVGQIKDACASVGVDPAPVVAAAMRGAKVMALGTGDGAPSALAVVAPDGRSRILGKGDAAEEFGPMLERHLMAAERGVEAVFDLLPIASPSR